MKANKNPWTRVVISRKVIQGLFLFSFLAILFIFQHRNGTNPWGGIFFWFDPLVAAGAMIAARTIIPLLFLALVMIGLTLVFGRVWCGWMCPMGTILDLFNFKKRNKKKSEQLALLAWETNLRKTKYVILLAVFGAALFGNLTLFVIDPITLVTRFYSLTFLPVVNTVVTGITGEAYKLGFFTDGVDAIESVIRGHVLPVHAGIFYGSVLTGIIFISVILLNLVRHRFFCRYLCPLGGLLGLVSKFAFLRRRVTGNCTACGNCERACTLEIIDKNKNYESDPKECTVCFDCFPPCPKDEIRYSFVLAPEHRREYDPSRRTFIAAVGFAALGTALLAAEPKRLFPDDYLLRPPGSLEEQKFLAQCTRCGECIDICPTSGLVGSLGEGGWGGIFAPRLVPRSGACDYGCKSCGEICPTGAITKHSLDDKRKIVIGKAFIDRSKCIAWADNDFCAVCTEFCPVRPKAVEVFEHEQMNPRTGKLVVVPLPYVIKENCIGCGTCENGCPIPGQAAIRVKRI